MNTNTVKLSLISLLAHSMCLTVVLSHIHAKDAVSMLSQQSSVNRLAPSDITAKALGDLHHHIDKAALKNPNATAESRTVSESRVRELDPLSADIKPDSVGAKFYDFLLRARLVASLCYHLI